MALCKSKPERICRINTEEGWKDNYLTFKDKRTKLKSPTAYVKVNGAGETSKDYVRGVLCNQCVTTGSEHGTFFIHDRTKTDMITGDFGIEETIPDFCDPNGNFVLDSITLSVHSTF